MVRTAHPTPANMSYDFSKQSDIEILNFINDNFQLFSENRSEFSLPKMLKSLKQEVIFIKKREEGFVVAQKESVHPVTDLPLPAYIHFLYVQKEFEGRKIGSELMRCVISQFAPSTRIDIVCEGQRRKSLFEKLGFQLLEDDNSSMTTFCMSINSTALVAPTTT